MVLHRRKRSHRARMILFLFAIFLILFLINKTFFTSFHEFRIKDVPSEVLENYFMLEAEYAIEWYYFALIDDPLDRRNLDEFIRQYNGRARYS